MVQSRPPNMLSIVFSSSLGTMLEYYDFFVYVALSATFTRLFFPTEDPAVGALVGAAGFGAAFLARPIGTLIFSPMADRVGRKKTFVVTLTLMGAATFLMGCLPSYATAGFAAPVALLVLRIVQGIALGGEYGSAAVYVMEHAPARRAGLYTSVLQGTAGVGLLIALVIVAVLKSSLSAEMFDLWGWRIPFLLSAPIVIVATFIRLKMTETPVFLELKRSGTLSASPLAESLTSRAAWKGILLAIFGAQGGTSVALYTSVVYMLYFLQGVLKVDSMQANMCVAVAVLVTAPLFPVFGGLSDRIGRARTMLIGIVSWMVIAYPAFSGIAAGAETGSWTLVTLLITALAALTAMIMAPLPAFISECFPPQSRTTGFGLAQQVGNVMFGGFLPLISLTLVNWTGNPLAGVGYSIASLIPCALVTYGWAMKAEKGRNSTKAAPPIEAQTQSMG